MRMLLLLLLLAPPAHAQERLVMRLTPVQFTGGSWPAEEPGNLIRDQTAPENTHLTPAQCARLRETGRANSLLQPSR